MLLDTVATVFQTKHPAIKLGNVERRAENREERPETRDQRPKTQDQRPETKDQGPATKDQGGARWDSRVEAGIARDGGHKYRPTKRLGNATGRIVKPV